MSAHAYVKLYFIDNTRPVRHNHNLVMPRKKNPHAVALGRKGGLKGGPARAAKLSAEERRNSAKQAAEARWRKQAKRGDTNSREESPRKSQA